MLMIRYLTPQDAPAYRSLRLDSFQEAPYAFSESFEDEQHRSLDDFILELQHKGIPPEWFVLGAFQGTELVGFVKFRRDQRSKARHKSMIHAMYTKADYRGQKIGQQILQHLLTLTQNMDGLTQIHLWVLHAQGRSAADFYRKLGFTGQGPLVKQDLRVGDVDIDAEYMVMYLKK